MKAGLDPALLIRCLLFCNFGILKNSSKEPTSLCNPGWGAGLLLPMAEVLWLLFPQHSSFSVALAGHLGRPGCKTCWSSCSEWQASPRGCSFFNPTFFPRTFPQFQKYLCRALQKPSGALLSRKSVWLLSESVSLISLKNKALGLGVVGVVPKEASSVVQKKALPTRLHLDV